MAILKYDIPLLNWNIRFPLWQVKMRTILAQINLDDALLGYDKITQLWSTKEK